MNNLITRHLLNKDLSLTVQTGLHQTQSCNRETLVSYINRAKTYLIKEKNCQPGQSVFLADIQWPSYLGWFFACAELGLNFVVSDLPMQQNRTYVGQRLSKIYGKIDFYIGAGSLGIDQSEDINNRTLEKYLDESCADEFRVEPSMTLIRAMTSGTTGEPKLAEHSHEFFYKLMLRNIDVFGFQQEHRCLHTKILHHGSVVGVYFLPSLKASAAHYWINPVPGATSIKELLARTVNYHLIDRVLLFYDMIDYLYADADKLKNDYLDIYVLSPVKAEIVDKLVGQLGYEITSIFGCTESSGPLFLQTLTRDDYSSKDLSNFGPALDEFYQLDIVEGELLEVTMPDGSKIRTGDRFKKVGDDFIFLGRNNLFKVRGQTILTNLLVSFLESTLKRTAGHDFNLVFDQANERIFLRIDDYSNLEKLNTEIQQQLGESYCIALISNEPKSNFMSGIKFDADLFRQVCNDILKERL